MIRSTPPSSSHLAESPVPAPAPMIGRPAARVARRRVSASSRVMVQTISRRSGSPTGVAFAVRSDTRSERGALHGLRDQDARPDRHRARVELPRARPQHGHSHAREDLGLPHPRPGHGADPRRHRREPSGDHGDARDDGNRDEGDDAAPPALEARGQDQRCSLDPAHAPPHRSRGTGQPVCDAPDRRHEPARARVLGLGDPGRAVSRPST